MTDHRAVAVVSRTLAHVTGRALARTVPGAAVTLGRPDGPGGGVPRVTIFLVRAGIDPEAVAVRPVGQEPSLLLNYLFSFSGRARESDLMLGAVTRALHESPVVVAQTISEAVAQESILADSGLESFRVTAVPVGLEPMAELWSGFFVTPYVLSSIYEVSGLTA